MPLNGGSTTNCDGEITMEMRQESHRLSPHHNLWYFLHPEASTDDSSVWKLLTNTITLSKEACFFGYRKFSKPKPFVNEPNRTSGDRCLAVPVPHDNQLCYRCPYQAMYLQHANERHSEIVERDFLLAEKPSRTEQGWVGPGSVSGAPIWIPAPSWRNACELSKHWLSLTEVGILSKVSQHQWLQWRLHQVCQLQSKYWLLSWSSSSHSAPSFESV